MNVWLMCVEGWLTNNFKGNFKVNSLDHLGLLSEIKKLSSVKNLGGISDGQINADMKTSFFHIR